MLITEKAAASTFEYIDALQEVFALEDGKSEYLVSETKNASAAIGDAQLKLMQSITVLKNKLPKDAKKAVFSLSEKLLEMSKATTRRTCGESSRDALSIPTVEPGNKM